MRIRLLALLLVAIALGAAGCGSDSSDQTTTQAPAFSTPEAGTQANGGIPGAGNPAAPDVTTTPGAPAATSTGKAGGGSTATCIGC
jgi:ABC-type glycerol-3-phosphate transport system substrate-binding protein